MGLSIELFSGPGKRYYNPCDNPALVTTHPPLAKSDVTIASSSQLRPCHNHTPRDNSAHVTTQNETLQSRPRHSHTPRDNSALVTTQNETLHSRPLHRHTPRDNSALVTTHHHLQKETLQSGPCQNHASRDNPALVTTPPRSQPSFS